MIAHVFQRFGNQKGLLKFVPGFIPGEQEIVGVKVGFEVFKFFNYLGEWFHGLVGLYFRV
jgi:hypothetical protein